MAAARNANALVQAVILGDAAGVQRLLGRGMSCNVRDRHGQLALTQATQSGNAEIVRALLRAGADPNEPDLQNGLPLACAVAAKDAELVRVLADAGGDVNARITPAETLLARAVGLMDTDTAAALLQRGARVAAATPRTGVGAVAYVEDRLRVGKMYQAYMDATQAQEHAAATEMRRLLRDYEARAAVAALMIVCARHQPPLRLSSEMWFMIFSNFLID